MSIQQIEDHIFRVAIPVPFPMKYVYCYLFKEREGWTIVDTGLHYPKAIAAWNDLFARLAISPSEIQAIYLTHFHPDHSGLAGWLQQQSGAPVYISAEDYIMIERAFGENSTQPEEFAHACLQHGVPAALTAEIKEKMEEIIEKVRPLPKLTIMNDDEVMIGGDRWEVIATPGHSDGMVCFYEREKKLLLAADHVLDTITPNISLWPFGRENPLRDYLTSLKKVSALHVERALPAHGNIITNVPKRIAEIEEHHEQRLVEMLSLAIDGKTAYDISTQIFNVEKLNAHQWRFAIAETLAHLEYLRFSGELMMIEEETTTYRATDLIDV